MLSFVFTFQNWEIILPDPVYLFIYWRIPYIWTRVSTVDIQIGCWLNCRGLWGSVVGNVKPFSISTASRPTLESAQSKKEEVVKKNETQIMYAV
jgi:hypothetical protein